MKRRTQNLRVGKRDVELTAPSHVRGVRQDNRKRGFERMPGVSRLKGELEADARRSTGICADAREPIDPSMPRLSPA